MTTKQIAKLILVLSKFGLTYEQICFIIVAVGIS